MLWLLASPRYQHPWYWLYRISCPTWGRYSTTCVMSVWRNDLICRHIFRFPKKKLAHKEGPSRLEFHMTWCHISSECQRLMLTLAWISYHMQRKVWNEITYPFPNFERLHFWSLWMGKFHPTLYNWCNYLRMMGSNLMWPLCKWSAMTLVEVSQHAFLRFWLCQGHICSTC